MKTSIPKLDPWSYTISWRAQPAQPPQGASQHASKQGASPPEKSAQSASENKPQNSLARYIFEPAPNEQWAFALKSLNAFGCTPDSVVHLRFSTHTVKLSVRANAKEVLKQILANCRRLITTQDRGFFPQNLPMDYPIKVDSIDIIPLEEYET
jgi:hypothetical protein